MNTTNTIPTTTLELADKYGEKLTSALEILADKIGVGVDHFWPVFVRQQVVEGMTGIIASIVATLVFFALIWFTKRVWGKWVGHQYEGDWFCITLGLVMSGLFFVFFSILAVRKNIPQVINPEYYAIMEIKDLVK